MILITEFMDEDAVAMMSAAHPTTYAPELADSQGRIPDRMRGMQALVVRNRTRVDRRLLEESSGLKLVARLGVGLDNIDLDACRNLGIEVVPATGANALSVAEYVVTCALMLRRGAFLSGRDMRMGDWPRAACSGRETAGSVLGLVGFGATARTTAELARGLAMSVVCHDPFLPPDDPVLAGVRRTDLDGVLSASDVVSLHVPLTAQTRHLIGEAELARMKPGTIIVNAARGGVLDEKALATALGSGHLGGAALDVFETEPLTGEAAELFDGLPNLILTPHIAGVTADSNRRVSMMIAGIVLDRLGRS